MKSLKTLLIFLPFLCFALALPISKSTPKSTIEPIVFKGPDYKDEWNRVDSLIKKGLTKTAIHVVDIIYNKAKAENNQPQLVKAVIHKIKFSSQFEENALVKNIQYLEKELETAQVPTNNLLHSLLGELYWRYYQNNRWRFQNRSATQDVNAEDINTWDLRKIIGTAISEFQLSMADSKQLEGVPYNDFDVIVTKGKLSDGLRPTLYDFLGHRAIDFFMDEEPSIIQPAEKFELKGKGYFGDANEFAGLFISSTDTFSLKYHATLLLQQLTLLHKDNIKNLACIADLDLKRLQFVHRHSVESNKDSIYLNTLQTQEIKYAAIPASTEYTYEIANFYLQQGNKYESSGQEEFRWMLKNCFDKCTEANEKFPQSFGANNCRNLQSSILMKNITFDAEVVVLPNQPARALLKYKNLATKKTDTAQIFIRISSLDPIEYRRIKRKHYGEELVQKLLKASTQTQRFSIHLAGEEDYQTHAAEFKIPALPHGFYVIFASTTSNFETYKNAVAMSAFTCSNISYTHRTEHDGTKQFLVLNRKDGQPIPNISAQLWEEDYDYVSRDYQTRKADLLETDEQGMFKVVAHSKRESYFIEFLGGGDRLFTDNAFYMYQIQQARQQETRTSFFTDRSIYRPGQTIHFKGLMLGYDGKNHKILSKEKTTVNFMDVNHQKVASLDLMTNEFGTFSGTFTAPTGTLTGNMHIENGSGNAWFSVEEYKRPKFEVSFEPLKGSYRLGDTVNITGKAIAYSGSVIDNAEVRYRVVRTASFPFPWYSRRWKGGYNAAEMEIANGTAKTNEKGEYNFKFPLIPDLSISPKTKPQFNYRVFADVTDISGETRSAEISVSAGYISMTIQTDFSEKINKEEMMEFSIKTQNLSGQFEKATVDIKIFRVEVPDKILRERDWKKPDRFLLNKSQYEKDFPNDVYDDEDDVSKWKRTEKVFEKRIETSEEKPKIGFDALKTLKHGLYMLQLESRDKYGEEVKFEKQITIYSPKENKTPYTTSHWFSLLKNEAEPGDEVQLIIGTSYMGARALVEVEKRSKYDDETDIAESRWLTLDNEQKVFTLKVKEEHRGNFALHVTMVKNNEIFRFSQVVTVPHTDKMLDIEFETFRNKIEPGTKEEWKLKIKQPIPNPSQREGGSPSGRAGDGLAEMLAGMYDASLDVFRPHSWNFDIHSYLNSRKAWASDNTFGIVPASVFYRDWNKIYPERINRSYDVLNWFGYNFYSGGRMMKSMAMSRTMDSDRAGAEMNEVVTMGSTTSSKEKSQNSSEREAKIAAQIQYLKGEVEAREGHKSNGENQNSNKVKSSPTQALSSIKARSNLNETAFFFPHLQTNEKGEIIFSFTSPEALTKWKMMAFAHTKDLKYGMATKEVVTQKTLMVQPNLPRFFREGDKMVLAARISNLSDKELSGNAQIFLFDALTMRSLNILNIDSLNKQKGEAASVVSFKCAAGQSDGVKWNIQIPPGIEAITVKIVAQAGNFTDGEEMAVPVLTNRMLVTEALPLPFRGKQAKTFTLDKLANNSSTTLRHHRLTLEFTPNPAWYAIQALPYMMEYPYECSEQIFSRYFANSLASHIANSSPQIKAVFESWKRDAEQGGKSLLSNLEKNQELKSILLEETPWVMNAKDESERKKRLGLLFDLNKMASENERSLRQLEKTQSPNGGFPWFPGMPDDAYITGHIVTGIGQLSKIGVLNLENDNSTNNMAKKAVLYLDDRIRESYENLKRHKTDMSKNNLSHYHIQYFYARSFFRDKYEIKSSNKESFNYFSGQSEKYWTSVNRYLQGMIALHHHRTGNSKTAKDIVKSLTENSLSSDEMGMYWKESYEGFYWYEAAAEAHALMIEVYDEVANDKKSVAELKVWLLKQKQTQDWKTTKATAAACYALLLKGADWLTESPAPQITVGDKLIDSNPLPLGEGRGGAEAGTGYIKQAWSGSEITKEMAKVIVTPANNTSTDIPVSWGALYWQYFEQLDKITFAETPLKLKKQLFLEKPSPTGPILSPVTDKTILKPGDLLKVRIELRSDRNLEYVHLKDMRAAGFEPQNVISRYKYQDGLGYYESTRDAATNFFFHYLPKGTYIFEYPIRVSHRGDFSNGITTIQCMYAPEFTSHSEGVRVKVE